MRDFRSALGSGSGFVPRTQAQALRGFAEGIINAEYFIYRAVNIHPILEEPWDLNEIDRILAKRDLDADTASLLMAVFSRMVKSKDKEVALFAAESVNSLERRFLSRVNELKKSLGSPPDARTLRAVVAGYRTLSRLFAASPVLSSFYLDEARGFFLEHRRRLVDPDLDIAAYIEILLEKRLPGAARRMLDAALVRWPESRRLRFLAAKLSFVTRRPREVIGELERLGTLGPGDECTDIQRFWTGGACHG